MEKLKGWNDIPAAMKDKIPVLKPGQTVRFQMLNGADNIHPEAEERRKQPIIYPRSNIVLKDRIQDPVSKDWINIGVWKEVDKDGNPMSFESFLPWAYGRQPYDGVFHLIGGRDNDDDKFSFLFLSTLRKDNEFYKGNRIAEFEIIDPMKISKGNTQKASSLLAALQSVRDMNYQERKDFAASMLWPSLDWDEEMLNGKLNAFAMEDSVQFVKIYGHRDLKRKALIGRCAQLNIIVWDGKNKVSYENGATIATLNNIPEGKTWIDVFSDHLETHSSGKKSIESLKKMLSDFAPAVEEQEEEVKA